MIIFAGCFLFMLLPTAYLPPIGYIARLITSETIVVEAWESYTKQTCRNHCNIYGPNGIQTLTIPVVKVNGNHTLTQDVRIANHLPWQLIHWRSIETAYNNSPFFLYYQDELRPFFQRTFDHLLDFNTELLLTILKLLKQDKRVIKSSTYSRDQDAAAHALLVLKGYRFQHPDYHQVFADRFGFLANLSIIDLLFNLGNEAPGYLQKLDQP